MNEYVTGTMNGFKQAQGEITVSTSNLRTISSDMKLATELFNKGQNDYAARLAQLQTASQKVLIKLLKCSKTLGSCQMSMYKSSISLNKDLVLSSLNCKVA